MLKTGGLLDPHVCFLLERSLKTFALRMQAHNSNALKLAQFLERQKEIRRVFYPGLKSHLQNNIAEKLLNGNFGGMLSFEVNGGDKTAEIFVKNLTLAKEATSLGGVESLVSLPHNTSQASLTKNQRKAIGINEGLVRFSTGAENIEDLIEDFKQAIRKTFSK
jgi:cystathionine beta-lyase/cystathionine gamma-synthase